MFACLVASGSKSRALPKVQIPPMECGGERCKETYADTYKNTNINKEEKNDN
jgi:hypothetical protein